MMAAIIDRPRMKAESREILSSAQVSPRTMVLLYQGISLVLNLIYVLAGGYRPLPEATLPGIFANVLTNLLSLVLAAGFSLYCMTVRRGQRAELLTLFDGFSFAGKIVGLYIIEYIFISLWSLLFVVPGVIAAYRYRFAVLNLCENPDLGIFEALNLSKAQTPGYKGQIFMLDLSYFGWMLLASLPTAFEGYCIGAGIEITPPMMLGYALLLGLWGTVVSLFYLANYQTTEIGYYEIAKQTSGAVPVQEPPRQDDFFSY